MFAYIVIIIGVATWQGSFVDRYCFFFYPLRGNNITHIPHRGERTIDKYKTYYYSTRRWVVERKYHPV
jgi:hypothetical protein